MKRTLALLCMAAVLFGVCNPAVFVSAETFAPAEKATDNVIVLDADITGLIVDCDTIIDLNGYDIVGVTVTDGTLYCLDSATADYTVADGIYGKVTGATGAVEAAEGYMQLEENGKISFHCVDLEIYAMTLRPDVAGVYYSSYFAGDELVAAQVETYGVALSVKGEPVPGEKGCGYSYFSNFQAGELANAASGTLLKNIMKVENTFKQNGRNADMQVYGRAYVKTAAGYVYGETVSRSLKEQVEAVDGVWASLQDAQKQAVAEMYGKYTATMGTWAVPNLREYLLDPDQSIEITEITLPIIVKSENGVVTETVTVEERGVSVTVPAGVQLAEGSENVQLSVTPKISSESGLTLEQNQVLLPVDVHMDGVSAENTVPITVCLSKILPENLNLGNYKIYHVENGKANEMFLIPADTEFTAHNQYKYDLDGNVSLHMATFSEVAAVVNEVNAWNGELAYDWYDPDAEQLYIRNADQLAGFGAIVGGMVGQTRDSFAGKTVTLLADIDLGDAEENNDPNKIFYPIGYYNSDYTYEKTNKAITSGFQKFEGTFDGNGNTIANFYQNTWEMKGDHEWYDANLQYFRDGMGLFGKISGGTVMNLTVKNFSSDGEITTNGVIAAYADSANGKSATFKNIAIVNCNPRVYNIGNGGIVGCAGWYSRNDATVAGVPIVFNSITVDQTNKISALWDATGTSCGGILGQYYPDSECGIRFEKCHTAAIIEANNDCCSNYHYYWYRYCGMLMGSVRRNKTEGGYTVADTTGIVAEDCTYTYGNWNDYWYCELVKNTIASYTHDHQFGRLTNIEDISEISNDGGKTWLKQGDFALLDENRTCVECYHIFKNSEGELYRHFHDVADETNPNIYENFDLDGNGQLDDLKEDRQRYCLPFVQVLTGDGMGVKAIQEFEGLTLVEDGAVKSSEKFDALIENNGIIVKDASMTIPELFAVKEGAKISEATIHVFVSPVGEESTVAATYACVSDGYMENTAVTFKGEGAAKITITDYYFCTPTVIYVTVGEAVPDPVEKFQATAITNVDAEKTVALGALFEEIADVTVNDAGVDVAVNGGTYEFVKNETDWTQSTITFTETATYTLTITDGDNCIATERTLTVDPIDKFALVFKNTDKYLYRVGNATDSTVALNLLFAALDGVTVESAKVTFTTVAGNASGAYTAKSPWTSGTIQFTGTGVVQVTIADATANPLTLNLEVVDAVNTTGAISATSSNVVLLKDCGLSSLTVSGRYTFYGNGFTATYTGNGQYLNNGLKLGVVNVSDHGTLDGLNIVGTVYPAAYLYHSEAKEGPSDGNNRYYYQLSAVAASGNATISNCYIYGTRNNIFVNTGNVTIKDTVLECGTLSNIQIQSSSDYTVTLENVTTIQHQVNPTMGDTAQVLWGAGVLVGPETTSNPKIVLNGSFKQYNWVTSADASEVTNETAQAIINAAVNATDFNHTVNGKTASNLGIVYMNQADFAVTNNTGLPYEKGNVSMKISGISVTGQVYSVKNASSSQIYSDYTTADKSVENSLYKPQFKYSADLGGQYVAEGGDSHCYRENDTIKVMFPSGDTKVLDLAALVDVAKYAGQDLGLVITCKDGSGNPVAVTDGKITLSAADEYTVTYAVTDTQFYDKDGNRIDKSISYSWDVALSVSLKDTAVPDAKFEFNADSQKMGYYKPSIGDVKQYLPFLAGLKIYDYNGQEEYLRFDGDADYNKLASVTITQYVSNEAYIEVKLTDGGVINTKFLARADSGGASTYTGSIKTSNNVVYFVNGGGTSNNANTTTSAYWYVDYYKFVGNNGVEVTSTQQTFNSKGSSASTPSGSFSTTIKYTVTYNPNEGNCGQTVGYATSVSASVTLPTATRSGYIFDGWYTAASGGTKAGDAGASWTPSGNVTLYAQWSKPCTVTYDANGGSCDTASAKYSGTALELPDATRDGYILSGWYTAASGGNKVGDAGESYRPSGDVTLYAQWVDATVEVTATYNATANGGSCSTGSATVLVGNSVTLPTPDARTGYTFNGWYDAASGGNKVGDAGASYTLNANITLYAQWTQIKYKINVTTSDKGGTWSGPTEATYGQAVSGTISYNGTKNQSYKVLSASGIELTSGSGTSCSFTMPAEDVTITISSGCLAEGTMITMADGTQKAVEQVSVGDMVLTWNFMEGKYEAVPVCLAVDDGKNEYTVITLGFEDNTTLRLIDVHGVFDADLNRYVYITPYNAENFVGHNFVKLNADGTTSVTKLVSYDVTTEYLGCYTIQTACNVNCVADGMLTQTPPLCVGYFDYFEMGAFMQYDTEKMQADIEQYGLYTYEDFADYLTYDAFMAFNGPYLKVAVGKGYFTFEYLIEQIKLFGIGIA